MAGVLNPKVEKDGAKESVWRNGDLAIRPGSSGSESNSFEYKDPDTSPKDASSMKALELVVAWYTNAA